MKCMTDKRLEAYQVKKNLKNLGKSLRTKIEVRLECFWEKNREVSRERSNEIRSGRTGALYRQVSNSRLMKVSTGIEDLSRGCQENTHRQLRCRGGIEDHHTRI